MDVITGQPTQPRLPSQRASLDITTRLPNYRAFKRHLATSLARCQDEDLPLSLLQVSVDRLAQIAARAGHAGRDEVLRETAALLTARLGAADFVARSGPDEFLLGLPGADARQAATRAEQVRDAIERHSYPLVGDWRPRCTASIGVVTGQGRSVSPHQLVAQVASAGDQARQMSNSVVHAPRPLLSADGPGAPVVAGPGPTPVGRLMGAPILLWGMVAGGLLGLIWSTVAVHGGIGWWALLPFLVLAVAAECLKVEVYQANQERLSLSFTIAVTMAAVTLQPTSAPLVSGLAALVHVLLRRQRRLDKVLFNLANPVLAAMGAGAVYTFLRPSSDPFLTIGHLVVSLVAVAAFYVVNIGLIVLMISLHSGRPLEQVMRETAWFGPTNMALGLTGAFVGEAHEILGLTGVVMFIVPLLVMRFTLALYAQQSQQTIATLEAARAEAEAAARAREEFLSVASHELKTPLTTVKGYVQMLTRALQQPVVEREHIARYAGYLQGQVARLEALVADLLDSSRIQQGRLDLHPEVTDLAELARHVLARFEHAAERQPSHRLLCEASAPLLGMWDAARLDQVLTNLISNALKYSPQGGEVRVRVRLVDDQAEVVVSDQGIGIPASERATLFQPFARGSATTRNIPGAGLGLYIAARIIERHGGSIDIQSEPGVGSTFTVRLPLEPAA